MTRSLRLAFMGTPDFARDILQSLIDAGHDVVAVYSQPPRPAGRGKALRPSAVHQLAEQHGIPVHTPKSLKSAEEQQKFAALDLDAAVVVAYGLLLPKAILDAPKYGCLNIHASLLPRWRGAAPIHRAIMAGDRETGIDVMVMEEGFDTGPVILERRIAIRQTDTTGALHDRLKSLGAAAIVPALDGYVSGTLTPRPQTEQGVCYAPKIDKAEARLDWRLPAEQLRNHIHGLSPFPGAYAMVNGGRIKMLEAEVVPGAGQPGELIAPPLTIACGDGRALNILRAQRAGKAPMTAAELQRGLQLPVGTVFS